MTTRRAIRKKAVKKFKVGDVVTWGQRRIAHKVIEIDSQGVWVDATSVGLIRYFVHFAPGNKREPGPPEHTDIPPDIDQMPEFA
jgi:hypothetical protein